MSNIINIRSIVAINCFDLSPSFSLDTHAHDDWEFLYADSGSFNYVSSGKRGTLKKGEILFHRPGVPHSTVCDGVHSASFFNMIIRCSSRAMLCFEGGPIKVPQELTPLLREMIDEAERSYYVSGAQLTQRPEAHDDAEQTLRNYTELFLLKLRRHICEVNNRKLTANDTAADELTADSIASFLAQHKYDRINLDMLSEHFHFGKTYLCQKFKKTTGKSIVDYHLDLKIAEAKRLLREENIPIREISDRLGFDSPEYFSRCFKKRVGFSPRVFRSMLITGTRISRG